MRKDVVLPALALVGGGAGAVLRYWQITTSLVQETMLFRADTPSTAVLLTVLAVFAALFFILLRSVRGNNSYSESFSCPSAGYMTLMAAGGFLLMAAAVLGFLEGLKQLRAWQAGWALTLPVMLLLTAALSAVGSPAALILGKGNYRGTLSTAYPLLAVLPAYAAVPWVVWLYQENSRQPQVFFYIFTLLAAICAMLGLYYGACFAFQSPKSKRCLFFSLMGIVLLITSLADRPGPFQMVMSGAMVLLLLAQCHALLYNCFGSDQAASGKIPAAE